MARKTLYRTKAGTKVFKVRVDFLAGADTVEWAIGTLVNLAESVDIKPSRADVLKELAKLFRVYGSVSIMGYYDDLELIWKDEKDEVEKKISEHARRLFPELYD